MAAKRICKIPGCGKSYYARGWCEQHYINWRLRGDPLASPRRKAPDGEPQRVLYEEVIPYTGTGCVFWGFGCSSNVYAAIRLNGRKQYVARVVCEAVNGPPPTLRHETRHLCGRGHLACVSPACVVWSTHAGNMADLLIHGTHTRGERNGSSKLTEEEVRCILYSHETDTMLARRFGVARATISDIRRRRTWAWLK